MLIIRSYIYINKAIPLLYIFSGSFLYELRILISIVIFSGIYLVFLFKKVNNVTPEFKPTDLEQPDTLLKAEASIPDPSLNDRGVKRPAEEDTNAGTEPDSLQTAELSVPGTSVSDRGIKRSAEEDSNPDTEPVKQQKTS